MPSSDPIQRFQDILNNIARTAQHTAGLDRMAFIGDIKNLRCSGALAGTDQRSSARLEAGKSRVPIIALTAHTMDGQREDCLAAGMDSFLPQPIPLESLKLERERLTQELRANSSRLTGELACGNEYTKLILLPFRRFARLRKIWKTRESGSSCEILAAVRSWVAYASGSDKLRVAEPGR